METIKLDCTYKEQLTKDKSKTYKALFVKLSEDYEKMVLLSVPEQKLIESYYKEETKSPYDY